VAATSKKPLSLATVVSLLVGLACLTMAATASARVVSEPVTFSVQNVNRSKVSCAADGATYRIAGQLVGPESAFGAGAPPRSVTLYLHGLGFGEFFWRFTAVPGYDYAEALAKAGHVSVVIDRLGYDSSDHPIGTNTCIGAQADIAHQIVGDLRTGHYAVGGVGPPPVAFSRVALAGHSVGGAIAQVEAYSFEDVDALAVISYADQSSQRAQDEFVKTSAVCATGGQSAEDNQPMSPGGYAYFGQTDADFQAAMFHNADPAVVQAATAARNRDPCGDTLSVPASIASDTENVPTIAVPVLLLSGKDDALFPPAAVDSQKAMYTGTTDLTEILLADMGHAVTLERTAGDARKAIAAWLSRRGF
jgi:pimeloyl-ACP methyl ester carboxylesterase